MNGFNNNININESTINYIYILYKGKRERYAILIADFLLSYMKTQMGLTRNWYRYTRILFIQ